jgi:N-acetylneuraminic acid mutarotase
MTTPREYATATLLPNGKVLVAGGEVAFEDPDYGAELYDPQTNKFVALSSTPGLNIFATATLLPNGRVLIAGGQNLIAPHFYSSLDVTALYDAATNTFAASPVMNAARDSATATLLPNGKVLIAGGEFTPGQTTLKSTELYTP